MRLQALDEDAQVLQGPAFIDEAAEGVVAVPSQRRGRGEGVEIGAHAGFLVMVRARGPRERERRRLLAPIPVIPPGCSGGRVMRAVPLASCRHRSWTAWARGMQGWDDGY
jgi:hypothetical protein